MGGIMQVMVWNQTEGGCSPCWRIRSFCWKYKLVEEVASPHDLDELIFGWEHEDAMEWCENLEMAIDFWDLNVDKLIKVGKLSF